MAAILSHHAEADCAAFALSKPQIRRAAKRILIDGAIFALPLLRPRRII